MSILSSFFFLVINQSCMFQWLNGTGCIQFLLKLLRKNSEIFQCFTKFLVDSVDSLAPREGEGRQSLETDRAISRRQQTINNTFTIQDLSWSLESISLYQGLFSWETKFKFMGRHPLISYLVVLLHLDTSSKSILCRSSKSLIILPLPSPPPPPYLRFIETIDSVGMAPCLLPTCYNKKLGEAKKEKEQIFGSNRCCSSPSGDQLQHLRQSRIFKPNQYQPS